MYVCMYVCMYCMYVCMYVCGPALAGSGRQWPHGRRAEASSSSAPSASEPSSRDSEGRSECMYVCMYVCRENVSKSFIFTSWRYTILGKNYYIHTSTHTDTYIHTYVHTYSSSHRSSGTVCALKGLFPGAPVRQVLQHVSHDDEGQRSKHVQPQLPHEVQDDS